MYPALEILRRPGRFFSALLLFAFTVSSASAQCYEFSGSGATIQITITSFVSRQDNQSDSDGDIPAGTLLWAITASQPEAPRKLPKAPLIRPIA
jgi:hypothetical protein